MAALADDGRARPARPPLHGARRLGAYRVLRGGERSAVRPLPPRRRGRAVRRAHRPRVPLPGVHGPRAAAGRGRGRRGGAARHEGRAARHDHGPGAERPAGGRGRAAPSSRARRRRDARWLVRGHPRRVLPDRAPVHRRPPPDRLARLRHRRPRRPAAAHPHAQAGAGRPGHLDRGGLHRGRGRGRLRCHEARAGLLDRRRAREDHRAPRRPSAQAALRRPHLLPRGARARARRLHLLLRPRHGQPQRAGAAAEHHRHLLHGGPAVRPRLPPGRRRRRCGSRRRSRRYALPPAATDRRRDLQAAPGPRAQRAPPAGAGCGDPGSHAGPAARPGREPQPPDAEPRRGGRGIEARRHRGVAPAGRRRDGGSREGAGGASAGFRAGSRTAGAPAPAAGGGRVPRRAGGLRPGRRRTGWRRERRRAVGSLRAGARQAREPVRGGAARAEPAARPGRRRGDAAPSRAGAPPGAGGRAPAPARHGSPARPGRRAQGTGDNSGDWPRRRTSWAAASSVSPATTRRPDCRKRRIA